MRTATLARLTLGSVAAGIALGLIASPGATLPMSPTTDPVPETTRTLTLDERAQGWSDPDSWTGDSVPTLSLTVDGATMAWDRSWDLNNDADPTNDVYVIGVKS